MPTLLSYAYGIDAHSIDLLVTTSNTINKQLVATSQTRFASWDNVTMAMV